MLVVLHEQPDAYEREYHLVRAALIAQGSSLNAWLAAQGIDRHAAYNALKGRTIGRKSIALRSLILREILGDQQAA